MYNIIIKHFYKAAQKSLFNKLFFRGRFIGKKIRLLIGRVLNVLSFNFFRIFLGISFFIAFALLLYNLATAKNNNVAIIASLISSTTALLLFIIPNTKKINSIMTRYDSPKNVLRSNSKNYWYQYYIVNISNPNDFSIPLEKIFLTNGDIVKDYDVIFINSNNSSPQVEKTMIGSAEGNVPFIMGKPTDLCILPPKKSILIKFATYKTFKHAYIQSASKLLYKVNITTMNYQAEYDIYRRGVFTNYDSSDYKKFLSRDWIRDEK
ncbi:hypothetical protein [Weissella paramesenteroides]|uniref:hypothetical protein n=1 Tax=Weissella paramesenteroides TaxID=1249 RepID=UPI00388D8034